MLVYTTKIESLRGMRIALDATCWLRSIQMLKDPYADALGGCSPGLFGIISKELDSFAKLNITPIFVFDGIVPPLQHQMFQQGPGLLHLDNAWTHMANNKDADAQKSFAVATSRINSDICHFVFHFLRSKGHECIRAPYVAGPQLAHFANSNMVQAVLGQPGLLLHGIKKVLLGIDFSKGSVEWIELDYILHQWGVNKAQFAEICLLAGTEYCLTYPYLNLDYFQPGTSSFSFQSAVDFIKQMPLANWMNTFPTEEMKNDHVNGYCVSKTLLNHCPIVNLSELQVEPFSSSAVVPSDLSTLIGERLPQSVYALLVQGHLSYRLPSVLATGEWNERQAPLIDTLEYRSLVTDLEEYRSKTLGLLTGPLPAHFRNKVIASKSYFDSSSAGAVVAPVSKSWLKWRFSREELSQELKRQNVSKVDLKFCLKWHANEFEKEGPLIRNLSHQDSKILTPVSDAESFTASTLLMVLETLDYISEEGSMTVLGDVLKDVPVAFQESVLLAVEMMKFGILTGEPLEAPPDGKPFPPAVNYPGESKNTREVLLLSRVLSLMPMNLRTELWAAKVDFDLAAFHCLVRSLNRALRLVVEGCVANQVLTDPSKSKLIPPQSFGTSDAPGLPALMLPRACLGIVAKFMLEYGGDAKSFEADAKKKFPCATDPVGDLKVGFAFWAELLRIVSAIAEPLGTTDMLEEMKLAGKLLEEKRRLLAL